MQAYANGDLLLIAFQHPLHKITSLNQRFFSLHATTLWPVCDVESIQFNLMGTLYVVCNLSLLLMHAIVQKSIDGNTHRLNFHRCQVVILEMEKKPQKNVSK